MNANSKAILLQVFTLLSLTIGPIVFCSMVASVEVAVSLMVLYGLAYFVLWALPVKCSNGLCSGRMKQTVTRISFWEQGLHYECEACGGVYEDEIFAPDISFEFSY